MKGKRFLLVILVFALSVSLLGCGEMSDAEVQLRYGLRMFFNRFNFFQPTSFYGFSGDNLFHTKIGVKLCSMAGGGVSRNLWNFFRTAPAGTGQAVTCSTSGMGLRLK